MLSCTQHVNHVTYLVAINKLYEATVTCLAQFLNSTSKTNSIQLCSIVNLIINSVKYIRKIIKPILIVYTILHLYIKYLTFSSIAALLLCMEYLIILLNNTLSLLNKFHNNFTHLLSNTQSMKPQLLIR